MGILDNDTVIVDAILTKIGRQKLAQGQPLGISKFAFGDTGVDYTLYNPNHPSGSDSYGKAITELPMLEAVPDDNVFMRSKLYGTGERNVQNFSFITVENTSPTITKIAGQTQSNQIRITPAVFPADENALFNFRILDFRGIRVIGGGGNGAAGPGAAGPGAAGPGQSQVEIVGEAGQNPSFDYPDPVIANINQRGQLKLTARNQQITSQKSFGIEVTREGAAPTFITVTVEANNVA
jgi:hypothetical protein